MAFSKNIGIDLGTANILVCIKGKGIVLEEPSVVAVDEKTKNIIAIGREAEEMIGRTPGDIIAVRPLRDGVISDYVLTEKMLKYFIKKVSSFSGVFRPKIMICVPSGVTEVEKRAVIEAASQAGAKEVYLIEEPVAAAIGSGLNIGEANGKMVVDIGGGTTDIAVISLGSIVDSVSVKIAGNKFDEAIITSIRQNHKLYIGSKKAENIKISIGTLFPKEEELFYDATGRDLVTGLPKTVKVSSSEIMDALEPLIMTIIKEIHNVFERIEPEIASDIFNNGILLTGGGALFNGISEKIQSELNVKCVIADEPLNAVVYGTEKSLEDLDKLTPTSLIKNINYELN